MEHTKVAMIEYVGGHGGNEFYDLGLCEAIVKSGIPVTLYTCTETSLDKNLTLSANIKKLYKNIYRGKSKLIKGFRFFISTVRTLRDCKKNTLNIAHFHIYHFSLLEFIPIWLFHITGIKTVATIHDIESLARNGGKNHRVCYLIFAKYLERVVVHSYYAKNRLGHYFASFDHSKIEVIPPLDIDFVYNQKIPLNVARQKLGLNMTVPILLFFGHIKKVKGLDTLISALALIRKEVKNIQLLIAGRPWKINFDYYTQLIRNSDLESNIILRLGYIPNESVPYYFHCADLVILPYNVIFNSSVLQRALAYSCAVVVSDLEPFLEIIRDGFNGLVFEAGNVTDLADKIIHILAQQQKMIKLQKNALYTARTLYSEDIVGRQMKNFYANI
jgi:D-inositol-3-phosphate glycosyltransferase